MLIYNQGCLLNNGWLNHTYLKGIVKVIQLIRKIDNYDNLSKIRSINETSSDSRMVLC